MPLNRSTRWLLTLAPWVVIVLVWYGVRQSGFVNPALIPAPHAVAERFCLSARNYESKIDGSEGALGGSTPGC